MLVQNFVMFVSEPLQSGCQALHLAMNFLYLRFVLLGGARQQKDLLEEVEKLLEHKKSSCFQFR